jgi:hypothetical protein
MDVFSTRFVIKGVISESLIGADISITADVRADGDEGMAHLLRWSGL